MCLKRSDLGEEKRILKKRIDVAAGRIPADVVIRNAKIVDVFSGRILEDDIAVSDGMIAGIGSYTGHKIYGADGRYAIPGLIDAHMHIESTNVTPEELGRMIVPLGTTTIIADPHEIVNVCGITGLNYMLDAAKNTVLDIKYMIPSCVPATPFEHSGAVIGAKQMQEPIKNEHILGLGEFMDIFGVVNAEPEVLDKILTAKNQGKFVDGHSPGATGHALDGYIAAGIRTDHECSTVDEMNERISRGMYVILREGSACRNLETLLKGVTPYNSRRCLLCTDDFHMHTLLNEGHMDKHLRLCVKNDIDPIVAIQMATLNAAECYGLDDRGAIACGRRADIVLVDDLKNFKIHQVFVEGCEAAREGKYLLPYERQDSTCVHGSFHVKDFSAEKLKLHLKSGHVHVIDIMPGGILTKKSEAEVNIDSEGEFVWNSEQDIVKVAVIERHKNTGNVGCGFLRGYGLKQGAVAISIAHDSHNIITVGISDKDIEAAVNQIIAQEGGIVLVKNGQVIENMPMSVGGIMSDQSGCQVGEKLSIIYKKIEEDLKVNPLIDPLMTLAFMSLPVIPELKMTDTGLFDVTKNACISLEVE